MLPRNQKIPSSFFSKKKKQKCIFKSELISCYQSTSLSLDQARFAVIVSKKRIKKAVNRNKVKRCIYSLIQEYYPQFCQNSYFIFRFNSGNLSPDVGVLREHIMGCIENQKKS